MPTTLPPFSIRVPEDTDPVANGAEAIRDAVTDLTDRPLRGSVLGIGTIENGSGSGVAVPATAGIILGQAGDEIGPIVVPAGITATAKWSIMSKAFCASVSTGTVILYPQMKRDAQAWTRMPSADAWGAVAYKAGATQNMRQDCNGHGINTGLAAGTYYFRLLGLRSDSFAHTVYLTRLTVEMVAE